MIKQGIDVSWRPGRSDDAGSTTAGPLSALPGPSFPPLPRDCRRGIRLRTRQEIMTFGPGQRLRKRNQHHRHRDSKTVGHVITG